MLPLLNLDLRVTPVSKPKVSASEKKYRQELFPDVREITNKNVLCTSCGISVRDLITKGKPISHPFLETLMCKECHGFYGDGQFPVDEDGSDKYCRWCGQGGTLFLCSKCSSGFCKKCVKRNLPKCQQAKIKDDDWVCYCCDTGPIYELRAQCWAAQQYAAEYVKLPILNLDLRVTPVSKPKVSASEKKYRQELFPDVREITNKNVLCTSCGISVRDLITKGKPISHPFLETLMCKECHGFYGDGQFPVDEDGSDKYCRWCGQGGTLFLCSKCSSGFCKKCVKRNLPKCQQAKIKDDDWVCYCCDTGPIYELRAQCWAAQQYAAEYVKNKGNSKREKGSNYSPKRSRNSDSSEVEETVPSKKKRKQELKLDKKRRNRNDKNDGGDRSLMKSESKDLKNDSGSESDDQTENSGKTLFSSGIENRIHAALDELIRFVANIARLLKETHKKLIERKNKIINLKSENYSEYVLDISIKLSSMLVTLISNIRIVRKGLEEYVEEWCKSVNEELKTKEEGTGRKVEDSGRLEDGVPSESSKAELKSEESEAQPETKDMEIDKSEEKKHPESDKENNYGNSPVEKKSPKKDNNEVADGDGKQESTSDRKPDEKVPLVTDKKQDESSEEGHGDYMVEGKKVISEESDLASSTAVTEA